MWRSIILYGLALAALLLLLKWLEWRFIIFDHAIEVYSGALALLRKSEKSPESMNGNLMK